jgi:DNA repair exonuclease SbcCD ATPase subunit
MAGSLRALEMKISHLDSESSRLREDIAEVRRMSNPYDEECASLLKDRGELTATRDALAARLAASRRSVAYLDYWVHGFGNKGIGSFLIEVSIPKLETRANRYLDILADGDVRIRLAATSESKKGTEVEEIDVNYDIEGDLDSLPSGGQLKKIEIAIDLAFMDLLAERDGAEIGLVMLDEILDGLDAEGRSRVMLLVEDLRRRKGAAHVISHDAELGVVFDRTILVVRKRGSKGAVSTVTEM